MHEQLKLSQTKKRDSNYLGDFGSEIRDTALIAYLLLKHEIAEETAFELSLKLENKVPKEKWLSTQEHVALALAGQQLAARNNKAWSVTFNEETASAIEGVGNETINLKERFENSTKLKNSGKTSIFISQLSSHYANALPEPESHGIAVKRNFYNKSGKKLNIEQLESGDLVVIEILVASNSYRPDTLVVDLLPAGWEIENQNLSTAMSAKAIKIHGRSLSELMEETDIQYQAFRDDRYVAALTTHANQTSRLYYLVRAVTPGKYYMPATYVEDMFAPSNRAIVKVDTPKITVSAK
jgi:uncharacterized protein YfaS (alpha-2-macroglobulin family)